MKKNKQGFTLIEVIAVIVILGIILMLVSVPASKYIFNSKMKTYPKKFMGYIKWNSERRIYTSKCLYIKNKERGN